MDGLRNVLLALLLVAVAAIGGVLGSRLDTMNDRLETIAETINRIPQVPEPPDTTTTTTLYPPEVSGLVCATTSRPGDPTECLPVPKPTGPGGD